MTEEHRYSSFALDLCWIEQAADPELEAHLAECARCRGYLAKLEAVDARPLVRPVRTSRWPIALVAFAAIVICLVVWRRSSTGSTGYVAAKGAPAVQVLVRRDRRLHVWDGVAAVRAGDVLALRVACEAMARVTVLVREGDDWTPTFDGPCSDEVLPFTLIVDDQPGRERIAVVLGRSALDRVTVARLADLQLRSAEVWALQFVFAKEP